MATGYETVASMGDSVNILHNHNRKNEFLILYYVHFLAEYQYCKTGNDWIFC
jgi:hypothetical protein